MAQEKVLSHPIAYTNDGQRILDYLLQDISLIRSPIVRSGDRVTIGADEAGWSLLIREEHRG